MSDFPPPPPRPPEPYGQPQPQPYSGQVWDQTPLATPVGPPLGGQPPVAGADAVSDTSAPVPQAPVLVAGITGSIAGIALCSSTFMTWVTAERLGFGTFRGNGWNDLDSTLSWGPLIAFWGVVLALTCALAVVGFPAVPVARTALTVSVFALAMATWQWFSIGRMSSDITAEPGTGMWVWTGSALVGAVCGAVMLATAGGSEARDVSPPPAS